MTAKKPTRRAVKKSAKKPGKAKRAQPETFRARSFTASLTVNDLQRSIAWYRDFVGFVVGEEWKDNGKVLGVSLKAGSTELYLNQDDGAKGWDRKKGEGMSLHFTTAQKVDDVATRIKQAGGTLQSEPTDYPWGERAFRVKDPDGFILTISSR